MPTTRTVAPRRVEVLDPPARLKQQAPALTQYSATAVHCRKLATVRIWTDKYVWQRKEPSNYLLANQRVCQREIPNIWLSANAASRRKKKTWALIRRSCVLYRIYCPFVFFRIAIDVELIGSHCVNHALSFREISMALFSWNTISWTAKLSQRATRYSHGVNFLLLVVMSIHTSFYTPTLSDVIVRPVRFIHRLKSSQFLLSM